MRWTLTGIALLCLAGAATATPAPPPVLEIHNDLGDPVVELYIMPAGRGSGTNRLEADAPLPPDLWAELAIDPAAGCRYDVGAVTTNGPERRAWGVDICAAGRIDLSVTRPVAGFPDGGPRFAPPGRGLPFCPRDPRCRKKP